MYIVAHKIHVRTKANNIETKIKFKNLNWSEVNQLAINIYFLNTSTAEYTLIYWTQDCQEQIQQVVNAEVESLGP